MIQANAGQKAIILVVEDEDLMREAAIDMVEEAGFEVISASDADEALRVLEVRNDIRAVVTDIQMPGSIDGLRLACLIRTRWPPMGVVVTSGRIDLTDAELPKGGRFLSKPYGLNQIGDILRELVC